MLQLKENSSFYELFEYCCWKTSLLYSEFTDSHNEVIFPTELP